jgi:hypothetical protein
MAGLQRGTRMRRKLVIVVLGIVVLLGTAAPAMADHTDPSEPLSPIDDPGTTELLPFGEGEWEFIRNFPINPGTDLKTFKKKGKLYAAAGTLGQGDEGHVGQRIIRLINKKGKIRPRWVADHGSANCATDNTGVTSLQHDNAVTPKKNSRLLIDTTDTTGRCHDPGGGGLELINISKIHKKGFKTREIHLTRHAGTSHTVTVDATRPWIVYNNASQSSAMPWIDVLNIKSCLNKRLKSTKQMRKKCRPKVYRIYLRDEWTRRFDANREPVEGSEASCHDITAEPGRIYCANLNSTVILDVRRLTKSNGAIRGEPLKCEVIAGTNTGAKVTDCDDLEAVGNGQARGWRYYGHANHAGRNVNNLQTEWRSDEEISVSHEAEPTWNEKWMFVTDERGGGIVPVGASCSPEEENPYGNGGVHVYKINKSGEFQYAKNTDGDHAVFIGAAQVASPTFCTAHVMQQIKSEQRFVIAWYTQGTKIVDWFIEDGKWSFRETASVVPQGPAANTWTSQVFKVKRHNNGDVTYWFMASDVTRGIDIFKWTGPSNPRGTPPPASATADGTPAEPSRSRGEGALTLGFIGAALLAPLLRRLRSARP